jgi:hypothetical protein
LRGRVMDDQTTATLPQDTDVTQFAALQRSRIAAASRRGVLAALSGGLMTRFPFAPAGADAKGKGKRKKRKKNKKRRKQQRGPETRTDATCPGPRDAAFLVNERTRLAQTFTATASGPLVRAELAIDKFAGSTGDYLLSLSPVDNSGVPTNDVLAVALVANAAVPDGESTVDFAFPDPVSVEAGDQFALVLTRLDGDVLIWVSRAGDICAGRGFNSPGQSTSFDFLPEVDFIFTTFVRS